MRLSVVILIGIVLVNTLGCVTQETGVNETATTSTTRESTTTSTEVQRLPVGEFCLRNDECISGCCGSVKGRHRCQVKSFCACRNLSESGCGGDCFWCIDECRNDPCESCSGYMRCLTVEEDGRNITRIEVAKGGNGSCRYTGIYENASGYKGYCDKHEGTRIYGKCGYPPTLEDCVAAYGEYCCYGIAQRRSFHSPDGEEYDLWCFECTKATVTE